VEIDIDDSTYLRVVATIRGRDYDREIGRLAIPALGALIAEPLYVLVDTAVVGHIGTAELGGLAVASTVLLTMYYLFVFLAYGTTASVARLVGAGDEREAAEQAVQSLWLAVALAAVVVPVGALMARPLLEVLGADGRVLEAGLLYLRISLIGVPALLVTLAGTGYLRGVQDTRTPLAVAVGTNILNLVLEVVLIYGLSYGIGASAAATVVAQTLGAAVYVRRVARGAQRTGARLRPQPERLRALAIVGRDLLVRTAALRAALLITTAVATRIGTVDLAAHQIAFELWSFIALTLDAIAIAGQAMVGRLLGAGDADAAGAAGRRMLQLGAGLGAVAALLVLAGRPLLPDLFTDDPKVAALAGFLMLWVAALQPVNGVVFVLDGLLIGAGDQQFLASAMMIALAVFAPAASLVLVLDYGIGWLWGALGMLMAARLIVLLRRWQRGGWAVTGATRAR
jgi:putative MATE family efflux protein